MLTERYTTVAGAGSAAGRVAVSYLFSRFTRTSLGFLWKRFARTMLWMLFCRHFFRNMVSICRGSLLRVCSTSTPTRTALANPRPASAARHGWCRGTGTAMVTPDATHCPPNGLGPRGQRAAAAVASPAACAAPPPAADRSEELTSACRGAAQRHGGGPAANRGIRLCICERRSMVAIAAICAAHAALPAAVSAHTTLGSVGPQRD